MEKTLEKIKKYQKPGQTIEHVILTRKPVGVVKNDGNVCMECGGIHLRTTGTCAVCETCGSSQGCS